MQRTHVAGFWVRASSISSRLLIYLHGYRRRSISRTTLGPFTGMEGRGSSTSANRIAGLASLACRPPPVGCFFVTPHRLGVLVPSVRATILTRVMLTPTRTATKGNPQSRGQIRRRVRPRPLRSARLSPRTQPVVLLVLAVGSESSSLMPVAFPVAIPAPSLLRQA